MAMTELQKNLLMLLSLTCSLCSGLTFKGQQKIQVNGVDFNHPFCQTLQMFVGECLCYVVFMWYKRKYSQKYESDRKEWLLTHDSDKVNMLIFSIPAFCDFITSTISFFAMNMMPLSMTYMFNGGNVIMTAAFSVFFLKRKLYRQNYLGITIDILALIFLGVMVLSFPPSSSSSDDDSSSMLVAIILTVCGYFTYASQMVIEENYFSKYFLDPFQVVGFEGVFGMFYGGIGVLIFSFITPPSSIKACENGKIEDFPNYLYQAFSFASPLLTFLVILSIFIIIVLNGVGQAVTKFISSLARAVLGVTSPILVWLACLIIQWETFQWYQLVTYFFITNGTLIYNEILVLPFMGFNVNLRRNLAAQKLAQEEQEKQLLSGPKKSTHRSHRSFKSIQQFNDEPVSQDEDD